MVAHEYLDLSVLLKPLVTKIRPEGTSGLRGTFRSSKQRLTYGIIHKCIPVCAFTAVQCPPEDWDIVRLLHPYCITPYQHTGGVLHTYEQHV